MAKFLGGISPPKNDNTGGAFQHMDLCRHLRLLHRRVDSRGLKEVKALLDELGG